MKSSVIAALAVGLCLGGLVQYYRGNPAMATSASPAAPLAAPAGAAQTGNIAPVLVPMQTLLVQMLNTGDTIVTSKDIVVHSRDSDNDYDPTMGEKRLGFAGVVSPLGLATQAAVGRDPTQGITMSFGIGIFRGLRPRLLTGVISGGASASTIIAYANQNTQWICLVEGTLVDGKRGSLTLLTGGAPRNFTDNMTVIVASRPNATQPWTLDGPRPLTAAERAVCVAQWDKAQTAGIIPSTEPFPP